MSEEMERRSELRRGMVLRELIAQERDGTSQRSVDLEPGCAYGVVTRQMVNDLFEELRAIRSRMDSLFSIVVGAITLDLLLRLAGWK
jgi:hypothetical protein